MILEFREFMLLKEGFKSFKLRDIIRKHGKPTSPADNVFLHDLADDEIVDVMSYNDFYDYRMKHRGESYGIRLEDGCYVVISIEHLKYALGDDKFRKEFEKRRNERHPGNQYNGVCSGKHMTREREDSIIQDFRKKRSEIEHRHNIENFKKNIDLEKVISELEDAYNEEVCGDYSIDDDEGSYSSTHEHEFSVNGVEMTGFIDYDFSYEYAGREYGAEYTRVRIEVTGLSISDEDDCYDIEELFDDTDAVYKRFGDLDETVESGIYDPYEYNGVSPYDFL